MPSAARRKANENRLCGNRARGAGNIGRSRACRRRTHQPFFPYCASLPDAKLKELGYAPIRNIYTGFNADKQPPYDPNLKDQIRSIKGTETVFWLTVSGNRAKVEETDARAVAQGGDILLFARRQRNLLRLDRGLPGRAERRPGTEKS